MGHGVVLHDPLAAAQVPPDIRIADVCVVCADENRHGKENRTNDSLGNLVGLTNDVAVSQTARARRLKSLHI
jgi:hypothetical protein